MSVTTPEAVAAFVRERNAIAQDESRRALVLAKAQRCQRDAARLPLGNRKRKRFALAAALFAASLASAPAEHEYRRDWTDEARNDRRIT